MTEVYLAGLCRTAVGSFGGVFRDVPAVVLGETVIREALKRAGIQPEKVDEVIFGNVLQAGQGQNPARQAAIRAGIPVFVPAATVNKVCGSGLYSVALACRTIAAGDARCVVAGGTESMSRAPYILDQARWGARMGDREITDEMIRDGLWDAFYDYHMGITAENVAERYSVTRREQDEFAVTSQQKAARARRNGSFDDEIVAVEVKKRKDASQLIIRDEYIREDATLEGIQGLRPAFKEGGTVTAGNSSGINDGAAAVIAASAEFMKENGLKPQLKVVAAASRGVDPSVMGIAPISAVGAALAKAGLETGDIDLFEVNEAFAAQSLAVVSELGLDMNRVNVNGGAIALGHPIGASGARILVTLAYEMEKRKACRGLATLCIGGGMGEAMIVERCEGL